jgi:hypothetical protein
VSARTPAFAFAFAFAALAATLPARAAAPPTLDTCTLATKAVVAAALGALVRDGRRLSGNGACHYRATNGPVSATIAERAGDRSYFEAYLKNAHDELSVRPHPLAALGERAAGWPGSVVMLAHGKFALITIIGLPRAHADAAALTIARDVATRL